MTFSEHSDEYLAELRRTIRNLRSELCRTRRSRALWRLRALDRSRGRRHAATMPAALAEDTSAARDREA